MLTSLIVVVLAMNVSPIMTSVSSATGGVTFDQCANGNGSGPTCSWINGDLQHSNSTYFEGDSTPQRIALTGLTPGASDSVTIDYATTQGGLHAYDFLTSYNASENWIQASDVCSGIANCTGTGTTVANTSSLLIPLDNNIPVANRTLVESGQHFIMVGGALTSASNPTIVSGSYSGNSTTEIQVFFTVGSNGDVALFFGAHVASEHDWGLGSGAASINGSPYHVIFAALNGASVGSRDNQMAANVIPPPATPTFTTTANHSGTSLVLGSTGTVNDTATVSGSTAGSPVPTGTVTFYQCGPLTAIATCNASSSNETTYGPVSLNGSGVASSPTTFTPTAAGTYCFGASYTSGDGNYANAVDNTTGTPVSAECLTVTANVPPFGTTANHSGTSLVLGSTGTVNDTATVTGITGDPTPTGSVTFYLCGPLSGNATCNATSSHETTFGPVSLNGSGVASSPLTFTPTATGTYCFGASYSGDGNYGSATDNTSSSPVSSECLTVTAAPSTTTTNSSVSGAVVLGTDGTASDTATISGPTPGTGLPAPTGTVSFTECFSATAITSCTGGSSVATASGPTAGTGDTATATSASINVTQVGYYCFGASYSGDTNYSGSSDNGANECFHITAAPSTTTTNSSVSGAVVLGTDGTASDTATISGPTPGTGLPAPTGTVSFTECFSATAITSCTGGSSVATASGPTAGTGDTATATSASINVTQAGYYCFGASYSGDTNYSGSSDNGANECFHITAAPSTTTTNSSVSGAVVLGTDGTASDTATISGPTPGTGLPAPTGTVSFTECFSATAITSCTGGSSVATASGPTAGSGDTATATSASINVTQAGYYCFGASYSGDTNYSGSSDNGANECFHITAAPSTTSTTASITGSAVLGGGTISDTVTVSGNEGGPVPTGTVTFYLCGPGSSATFCAPSDNAFDTETLVDGSASSISFTPTAAGTYCFGAVFTSGDANYANSADNTNSDNLDAIECVTITAAPSTTSTTASITGSAVLGGGTISDTVTVSGNEGGPVPTGTVTFYLCSPGSSATFCAPSDNAFDTETLVDGSASSISFTPTAAGTYCFG